MDPSLFTQRFLYGNPEGFYPSGRKEFSKSNVVQMRGLHVLIGAIVIFSFLAPINPGFAYSRVTEVNVSSAKPSGNVGDEIAVVADIKTGNNLVEYTHNVVATLILPSNATIVSGVNPVYIGEMGPGPSHVQCQWTIGFQDSGEFILVVNASCIDTQTIPRWMNSSATVRVYAPPHVEFEYAPANSIQVNDTITFNATASYARGPDDFPDTYSWSFGDGTNDVNAPVPIVRHRFTKIGNFSVSLNVTDIRGLSNTKTALIEVSLFADINHDGQVNILDITIVAMSFGSTPSDTNWNSAADLHKDGIISILDVFLVAREYGKTAEIA
jgi:hypothetical protein